MGNAGHGQRHPGGGDRRVEEFRQLPGPRPRQALYRIVGSQDDDPGRLGVASTAREVRRIARRSGPALVGGALALALAIGLISVRPVVGQVISPNVAWLLLVSSGLLRISLPAMYAVQAEKVGAMGLVGHVLLAAGLLLPVVVAATLAPSGAGSAGGRASARLLARNRADRRALVDRHGDVPRLTFFRVQPPGCSWRRRPGSSSSSSSPSSCPPRRSDRVRGLRRPLALGFAWIGVALWVRTE